MKDKDSALADKHGRKGNYFRRRNMTSWQGWNWKISGFFFLQIRWSVSLYLQLEHFQNPSELTLLSKTNVPWSLLSKHNFSPRPIDNLEQFAYILFLNTFLNKWKMVFSRHNKSWNQEIHNVHKFPVTPSEFSIVMMRLPQGLISELIPETVFSASFCFWLIW